MKSNLLLAAMLITCAITSMPSVSGAQTPTPAPSPTVSPTPPPVSVTALYELRSSLPGQFIPVKLTGSSVDSNLQVISSSAQSSDSTECKVIADPYIPFHFLAKCRAETQLTLTFKVFRDNKLMNISYGPIDVKLPKAGLIPVGEDELQVRIKNGAKVFSAYCARCHLTPTLLNKPNVLKIQNAIDAYSEMRNVPALQTLKTDTEALKDIEAFLGSL